MECPVHMIIAVGGTGGHLFPAQAFAHSMLRDHSHIRITFVGSGLKNNAYFEKDHFDFLDIKSAAPMTKHPIRFILAWLSILQGLICCMKFYKKNMPQLIVGFGSYHTFPALLAGKLKKIGIIIFEPNVFPGRVNRFFSKWAKCVAIQFPHTSNYLKASNTCVHMSVLKKREDVTMQRARDYFHLDPERLTLLVFGGSQGAHKINQLFCGALEILITHGWTLQVIHILGRNKDVELHKFYHKQGILACVKSFEERMDYAWAAASLNISRAGASTLSELIEFTVPTIFIPYPFSTEHHQEKNAAYVANIIRGGVMLEESKLNARILAEVITDLLSRKQLPVMRQALHRFKEQTKKEDGYSFVLHNL